MASSNIARYEFDALQANLRRSTSWFYWIAALSVFNTLAITFGADYAFFIGLGITQIIDGIAYGIVHEQGGSEYVTYAAAALSLLVSGTFAVFGWCGQKRILSVYIIGLVFYALDGLIFLAIQAWMPLAFHGLALFYLFRGVKAIKEYRQLEAASRAKDRAEPPALETTAT